MFLAGLDDSLLSIKKEIGFAYPFLICFVFDLSICDIMRIISFPLLEVPYTHHVLYV